MTAMSIARLLVATCLAGCGAHATPVAREPPRSTVRVASVSQPTAPAKRKPRIGELDPADTHFPEDWRSYDAFTFIPTPWESKSIEIIWSSKLLDGYVSITITPAHVYVHSGHDNPNPNYIYWVGPSTPLQRTTLARIVVPRGGRFDCNLVSRAEGMQCSVTVKDTDPPTHTRAEHLATAAANIADLFATIHRSWPADVPRLRLPTATDLDSRHVLFAENRAEIDEAYMQ